MLATLIVFSHLFLVGAVGLLLLGWSREYFFWSILMSTLLSLFAFGLVQITQSPLYFGPVFLGLSSIWLLAAFLVGQKRKPRRALGLGRYGIKGSNLGLDLLIVTLYAGYTWVFGVYDEVPADIFAHLEAINFQTTGFEQNLFLTTQPWYFLIAYAIDLSKSSTLDSVKPLTIFFGSLFLLSIKRFTLACGQALKLESSRLFFFALSGTVLTFLLFGTHVFSYVRYYAISPGILAFTFFLGTCAYLLELERNQKSRGHIPTICTYFILSVGITYIFHKQETLFILATLTIWALLWISEKLGSDNRNKSLSRLRVQAVFVALLGLITILAYLVNPLGAPDNSVLINNTIDLRPILGSVRTFIVGDPGGRIFETLGIGGAILVLLWFSILKPVERPITVNALVIAPFFIAFNPVIVHWLLGYMAPEVLWRVFYLIPTGLIATTISQSILSRTTGTTIKGMTLTPLLVVLLVPLPVFAPYQYLRYPTLRPVHYTNSPNLWIDMVHETTALGKKRVLTDPVTGYVVGALGRGAHAHRKFSELREGSPNRALYTPESFLDHAREGNWIMIVNLRDGGYSEVGDKSNHWSGDIMRVRDYYSEKLISWLGLYPSQENTSEAKFTELKFYKQRAPKHIKLLWHRDQIWIFDLRSDADS